MVFLYSLVVLLLQSSSNSIDFSSEIVLFLLFVVCAKGFSFVKAPARNRITVEFLIRQKMSSKEVSANGKDNIVSKETTHPAEGSPKEDSKNRGWPKGKKRYPKSPGAPKQPLSGYVHFLNFRRDSVRKEFPEMSFADISKKLAQEWSQLDASDKQTYAKKAEEDKERYNREFSEYQQTDEYKKFLAMEKDREKNHAESATGSGGNLGSSAGSGSKKKKSSSKEKVIKMEEQETNPASPANSGSFLDIPIFRDEFLEHNKAREAELKQLRKQVKLESPK